MNKPICSGAGIYRERDRAYTPKRRRQIMKFANGHYDWRSKKIPKGMKPVLMRCPTCGRRVKAGQRYHDNNMETEYYLPYHLPKKENHIPHHNPKSGRKKQLRFSRPESRVR